MPRLTKSLRDLILYILSGGFVRIIPLLILPYVAQKLTDTEFGIFSLYRLYIPLGTTLLLLGVEQGLFRYIPGANTEDKNRFTGNALYFITIYSLILIIVFLLGGELIQSSLFDSQITFSPLFLPVMFFLSGASTIVITRLSAEKKSKQFFLVNFIRSASFFTIFAVGLFLGYDLVAFFFAYFISEITVYLFSIKLLLKSILSGFEINYLKRLFKIGMPLMGVMLASLLLYQSDHYLIKIFLGVEQTGVYNYGYKFAAVISIFVLLANNVWMPRLYEKGETFIEKYLKDYSSIITLSCSFILLTLLTIFYYKSQWLIPAGFEDSFIVLGIVGFGYLFYAHAQFLDCWLILDGKTGFLLITTIIALIFNLILNILFIPEYGILAAGVITSISFFMVWIFLIIYLILHKKNYRFKGLLIEFISILLPSIVYLISGELLVSVVLLGIIGIIVLKRNDLFLSIFRRD